MGGARWRLFVCNLSAGRKCRRGAGAGAWKARARSPPGRSALSEGGARRWGRSEQGAPSAGTATKRPSCGRGPLPDRTGHSAPVGPSDHPYRPQARPPLQTHSPDFHTRPTVQTFTPDPQSSSSLQTRVSADHQTFLTDPRATPVSGDGRPGPL